MKNIKTILKDKNDNLAILNIEIENDDNCYANSIITSDGCTYDMLISLLDFLDLGRIKQRIKGIVYNYINYISFADDFNIIRISLPIIYWDILFNKIKKYNSLLSEEYKLLLEL